MNSVTVISMSIKAPYNNVCKFFITITYVHRNIYLATEYSHLNKKISTTSSPHGLAGDISQNTF